MRNWDDGFVANVVTVLMKNKVSLILKQKRLYGRMGVHTFQTKG